MATREDRLTALEQAVDQWSTKRQKQLNKIIESHKKLLKNRGELANVASSSAKPYVVGSIQEFLL